MLTYQIDLFSARGSRDCLLSIMCIHDLAAIVLAKSIFKINSNRASKVTVWRDDQVIFEDARTTLLN
jgi:hypothetical protein